MPKKTKLKRTSAKSSRPLAAKQEGFLSQIKWGESYTSLFLGAVVVLVALVLVFSFFKSRNFQNQQTDSTSTNQSKQLPETYTVKEGDDLWSVSEELYGSGYNWVDLASTNKLENPGVLYVGTKLNVPSVTPKAITVDTSKTTQEMPSITGVSYKVVEGDSLWSIAVRSYGDGYKWTEIAKVNSLQNPNLIHPGNVLKLPR